MNTITAIDYRETSVAEGTAFGGPMPVFPFKGSSGHTIFLSPTEGIEMAGEYHD